MLLTKRFSRAVAPLVGLPCWDVSWCAQTGLRLEFGHPSLWIVEPKKTIAADISPRTRRRWSHRRVHPRGTWTFWINHGRWRLQLRDELRVLTSDSWARRINETIGWLDGQRLVSADLTHRGRRTTLAFDLGAVLVIQGSMLETKEVWTLRRPRQRWLSLRADGSYRVDDGNWQTDPPT